MSGPDRAELERYRLDSLLKFWAPLFAMALLPAICTPSTAAGLRQIPFEDRYLLPISSREVSSTIIQVRINGLDFFLPADRADGVLESDKIVKDELRGGFTFLGRLPSLAGRTPDTLPYFLRPELMEDVVYTSVWRGCTTDAAPACEPDKIVQHWIGVETMNAFPPDEGLAVESVPGLELFAHSAPLGKKAPTEDIFVPHSGSALDEFIICDRQESVPVPHCRHRVVWRDGLYLTIRYRRTQLGAWGSIEDATKALLKKLLQHPDQGASLIHFPVLLESN